MTDQKIYIKAATQISMQQPLSEAWLTAPERPNVPYQRSQDPNFRDWLNPLESRRMGKLMKRALVTDVSRTPNCFSTSCAVRVRRC